MYCEDLSGAVERGRGRAALGFEFESTNQRKALGSASGSLRLRYLQERMMPTTYWGRRVRGGGGL